MKKRTPLSIIWQSICLCSQYIGKYLYLSLSFLFLGTVVDALSTLCNARLFDTIAVISPEHPWTFALVPLILLGSCLLSKRLFYTCYNQIYPLAQAQGTHSLQIPLNEICSRMAPIEFENSDTLDSIGKAVSGSSKCTRFVFSILYILADIPYALILGIYLYTLRPILTWSILLIFLPVVISQILKMTLFKDLEDTLAPLRRKNDYYDRCISHRDFFKETRLLGAYRYFANQFQKTLKAFTKAQAKTEFRGALYQLISGVLTLIGYLGVLILLFNSVMDGYISIGAFAAVFSSLASLIDTFSIIINYDIGDAVTDYSAVQNYVEFLDRKTECKTSSEIPNRGEILLKDVHFSYPGSDREVIQGITFQFHPGEIIAVVGENGAGKSTLMRLITGQYLATSGQVISGGKDLATLNMTSRFDKVTAVFQKFNRYRLNVAENISLSTGELREADIVRCAGDADVNLKDNKTFPDGKDTVLSREFGGVDLSGGQWQRVALARGLYRSHDLIILDEPTAAIDPMEETRLYKKFSQISQGKTSIIVTHRLGSARIADRILVLRNGQIDDVGTHEALLARNGYYAKLYESQAEWYN